VEAGERHPMELKKDLAAQVITDYHSAGDARAAREEFERVFAGGQSPEDIETATRAVGEAAVRLPKLLAELGLAASGAEANRLVKSGAVTLNGDKVTDPSAEIDFSNPVEYLFKVGKRRFLKLVVE
jgi:tyrosyl-tRNA synthetase